MLQTENSQAVAAAKAGTDVTTARKYRRLMRLPGEIVSAHTWRTRGDPFAEVWEEVRQGIWRFHPGLQAKVLFQALRRKHPSDPQGIG